ncbi:MAG TPA: zinc-ribbon domain-containing protein [Anaerolineales bacterium]|nr:zinc-ribbon domain-containing protein [Anaerolineales bacterium]
MAGWRDVANIWKNVREVDLRPIRDQALRGANIALVGDEGSGRRILAERLRRDPHRPESYTQTPVAIAGLDAEEGIAGADLLVLMIQAGVADLRRQRAWAHERTSAGNTVIVFYNREPAGLESQTADLELAWDVASLVVASVDDTDLLLREFVPAVLKSLPEQHLSLARDYPLFRGPVAQELINDTCFSNAAYALSTGIAEVVPVLDIPLNITDMIVLTKAQAFLVYRLGLALGFSTQWQDYVTEFGSVIGGGFLWRQVARSLVGLIPVWGIVPKVAVAYAGTYVVGNVVLRWYLTGRHLSRKQIRELYRQAFAQGKLVAQNLLSKAPRPRLRGRKPEQLPASSAATSAGEEAPEGQVCPNCGRISAADAKFCQYCGQPLSLA